MIKLLLLLFLFCNPLMSRDYSQPPSLAVRNEVSFVSVVTLDSIKQKDTDYWTLHFSLLKDIHNQSQKNLIILVSAAIAKELYPGMEYIIAYQTHRKFKENGISNYMPNSNGAELMSVDGAKPALFRSNKKLLKQFDQSPQMAQSQPQSFIENIIIGMQDADTKIQDFFIRELINWPSLHRHITKKQFNQLLQIYNSPNLSIASLTAFLETRISFQKSLGIKSMSNKINQLLESLPVHLDANSQDPSFILQALKFLDDHDFYNRVIFSRWLESNIPSISEKSLLTLNKYEPKYTIELVKKVLMNPTLNESSRNVLKRTMLN